MTAVEHPDGCRDGGAEGRRRREPPLVEVQNLVKYFPITGGLLRKHIGDVHAVDDVSFEVDAR